MDRRKEEKKTMALPVNLTMDSVVKLLLYIGFNAYIEQWYIW